MVFFNDRDHALDTDAVSFMTGYRDAVSKERFFRAAVCHINAQLSVFFVNFQVQIPGPGLFGLFAGMDGIFQCICQETAQISNSVT